MTEDEIIAQVRDWNALEAWWMVLAERNFRAALEKLSDEVQRESLENYAESEVFELEEDELGNGDWLSGKAAESGLEVTYQVLNSWDQWETVPTVVPWWLVLATPETIADHVLDVLTLARKAAKVKEDEIAANERAELARLKALYPEEE